MPMQKRLREICSKQGLPPRTPGMGLLVGSPYHDEVMRVYQRLGGCLPQYPIGAGTYDISTENFDMELDEYLHFNRYRQITLGSAIYNKLPKFPMTLYDGWCEVAGAAERKCLHAGSHGKRWRTDSADRQFGISNAPGDLSGNGSSRWKQRAFYDYLKDALQLLPGHSPLVRISIYDRVKTDKGEFTVEQILTGPDYMNYAGPILALIESRLPDIEK